MHLTSNAQLFLNDEMLELPTPWLDLRISNNSVENQAMIRFQDANDELFVQLYDLMTFGIIENIRLCFTHHDKSYCCLYKNILIEQWGCGEDLEEAAPMVVVLANK